MTYATIGLIVLGVAALVVVFILARTIRTISAYHEAVVERFGSYHRTLQPGVQFMIPLIEKKLPNTYLGEQAVSYEHEMAITKDNYQIQVSMVVYHRITDARAAEYEVENLGEALEEAVRTSLREVVGNMKLGQALNSREELNQRLRLSLDEAVEKWGVRITRVEVKEMIQPDYIY